MQCSSKARTPFILDVSKSTTKYLHILFCHLLHQELNQIILSAYIQAHIHSPPEKPAWYAHLSVYCRPALHDFLPTHNIIWLLSPVYLGIVLHYQKTEMGFLMQNPVNHHPVCHHIHNTCFFVSRIILPIPHRLLYSVQSAFLRYSLYLHLMLWNHFQPC